MKNQSQEMYFYYAEELKNNPTAKKEYMNRLYEAFRRAKVNPYKKADMRRLDKPYVTRDEVKKSLKILVCLQNMIAWS